MRTTELERPDAPGAMTEGVVGRMFSIRTRREARPGTHKQQAAVRKQALEGEGEARPNVRRINVSRLRKEFRNVAIGRQLFLRQPAEAETPRKRCTELAFCGRCELLDCLSCNLLELVTSHGSTLCDITSE